MANLYADENYPYPAVLRLRALGHDVLTAQEDGRANRGIDDPDVLARATQLGRAVLTEDRRDYHRLHRLDPKHAGIITSTRDPDWDALAARVNAGIASLPTLAGRLVKVVRPNRLAPP